MLTQQPRTIHPSRESSALIFFVGCGPKARGKWPILLSIQVPSGDPRNKLFLNLYDIQTVAQTGVSWEAYLYLSSQEPPQLHEAWEYGERLLAIVPTINMQMERDGR